LPHIQRDPETGQFVSSSTGHVQRFRDYEFQHVHSEYDIDASDLPGSLPLEEPDIRVLSMDDLLHRDERADLVALNLHSLQASIPGTSTAESTLKVLWELSTGAGARLVEVGDANFTADTGVSGAIDSQFWDSDDPDILYFADWNAEAGFSDTGNSVAAGPDAPVLEDQVHFPREFGACPEFDERDEITESFRLESPGDADISDSLINLQAAYSLVFAVHDG